MAIDLDIARKKLTSLQEDLARASIPTTIVELHEGESKFVVENTINLALISAMGSSARIRLANVARNIDLGETIDYVAGTKKCRITLVKGTTRSANFQNSCS